MNQGQPPVDPNETTSDPFTKKLMELYQDIAQKALRARGRFPFFDLDQECSRDNLLAYLALRGYDLLDVQLELADRGLSSLGRLEGAVMTSLRKVLEHLGSPPPESPLAAPSFSQARGMLSQRSTRLLGRPRLHHQTRIMVTLDTDTLRQPDLLEQLLLKGMDIARINCAHDTSREWLRLIEAVRDAETRLAQQGQGIGRRCRIVMDLAGPKVRTGPLKSSTRPLKLSVEKDLRGRPRCVLEGHLTAATEETRLIRNPGEPRRFVIALPQQDRLNNLSLGDDLTFVDTRGRTRLLRVLERASPTRVRVGLNRTAYIEEGTELMSPQGFSFRVGPITDQPVAIHVQVGDHLRLYRDPACPGHPAEGDQPAGIACTLPAVLEAVQPGHRVFIDDGKIGARVLNVLPEYLELEIMAPRDTPARIRAEKGLNFPDSAIEIPALTEKDREDLRFVVKHATAVGLSFVHRPRDLDDLRSALKDLGNPEIGIVIKIETRESIHRLAQLLLAGLDLPKFGVMIARGDLAVEVGFEHLALVQEDILCMCEAAHIPVIWATQVLENLTKSGLAARAEITDAATGQRAECVMLNKGAHIIEAVKTLGDLLSSRERQRVKKRQVFREITAQYDVLAIPGLEAASTASPAAAPGTG
ncbi:pyruvate kinase [Nitrospira sp.]|nr:pyruvate kinase [Nitrospira sp.]